ncbi:p53 negative regulator [Parasponia andersonii]|uniref:p53 negative regulator n=1 Tax=Parasponia andersonii TaxID=3476 RepID=A0A2P5BGR1_PARAD|nr:p53 negative regulator [Parasponia andersonii]
MEGEEEEASHVNTPPFQLQDATATTTAAAMAADPKLDVPDAELRCDSIAKPDSVEEEEEELTPPRPVSGLSDRDTIEGAEEAKLEDGTDNNDVAEMPEGDEEKDNVVVAEEVAEEAPAAADVEGELPPAELEAEIEELETEGADAPPSAVEEEEEEEETGMVRPAEETVMESEKADVAEAAKEEGMDELVEETGVVNAAEEMRDVAGETNLDVQVEETDMANAADVEDETAKEEEAEAEEEEAVGEEEGIEAGGEEDKREDNEVEGEEGERERIETEGEGEGEGEGEEVEREGIEAEGEEEGEGEDGDVSGMADETKEREMAEEADVADVMEETTGAEAVEEAEAMEVVEEDATRSGNGGKRKRGKSVKAPVKVASRKKMEEDVCFVCFDGGELVLCDKRGCPKAYHPSCVNRDEAFFRSKGRWNCGWHLCTNCGKNAYYMCYTCPFSLCKGCVKDATILCVRENKGFCETCMRTVMLIEKNEGNKSVDNIDFDDKSSWEYLFKDYWIDLKGKLSLAVHELAEAKNPWKGSDAHKQESADEPFRTNNDVGSDTDGSSGNLELSNTKKRKTKKRMKSRTRDKDRKTLTATGFVGLSVDDSNAWASKELLEFVMHMRNGNTSVLSQFDVQALLLEYIKRNKLRDPRRKSQIICDSRLENLFGKPRVGHFEMLKLLESHFLIKEDFHADDLQGSVVDTEASQLDADGNSDALGKTSKDKKRKTRRKGDGKGPQSNLDDYAAIDTHNINLIYLRRNLVEDLFDDAANFHDKVVGAFARIRISGSGQKQDLYRLVQVVGTCKASEPYKVGKRMTDTLLEILNLNKTEVVSIDIISNQEFTEDECKRLRQSIKCGLINRLTVGSVQEKAMALQSVRVKDWLESEIVRLSHLRDRASEKGHRKEYPLLCKLIYIVFSYLFSPNVKEKEREVVFGPLCLVRVIGLVLDLNFTLRECVEKLQVLKTPEERQRRLEDIPEIHADPNMDPSFESEEEEADEKRQENITRPRGSGFGRRGREPISPRKGGSNLSDTWTGSRNYTSMNQELSRSMPGRGFSSKVEDTTGVGEILNDSWNQGRDREIQQPNSWEKQRLSNLETGSRSSQSMVISESFPGVVSESLATPLSTGIAESASKINETEKIWHYQDPSGKVQGPFSIAQLRKWSGTGYFPAELKIWKTNEKQDDSILLTDALVGQFLKDKVQIFHNLPPSPTPSGKPQGASTERATEIQVGGDSWRAQNEINSFGGKVAPSPVELPKYSSDAWGSTSLPSPTPSQTPLGAAKAQAYENKWSGNSVLSANSMLGVNQYPGNTGSTRDSVVRVAENDSSSLPGIIPASMPEKIMPLGSTTDLPAHHLPTVSAPLLNHISLNTGADIKNVVSNLQSLVQSVASHIPSVETQGWASVSVPKPEMLASGPTPGSESQPWRGAPSQNVEPSNLSMTHAQPPAHGQWSDASAIHNSASSFSAGNAGGNFPTTGFTAPALPSDSWGPSVSSNQPNVQPPAPPNLPYGMGVVDNQSAVPRVGQENQNPGWGPVAGNPNMGWSGQAPGNANMNWGVPGQGLVPGNTNPGWPNRGLTHGNSMQGWVPPGQGPAPVSNNANQGWVGHGQGQPPGNPGWAAPSGNAGSWGTSHNTDRFATQREKGSQGGDSGYGGGKPWNRQSSFGSGGGGGGGSSRSSFKGQRVCKFHENGHCKKGASCDYLHT